MILGKIFFKMIKCLNKKLFTLCLVKEVTIVYEQSRAKISDKPFFAFVFKEKRK
jgi:hypothetical protein